VIDGDVLNDIRDSDKVVYVILNGRIYDAETMNYIGGGSEKKRTNFYFESRDNKEK